MADIAPLPFINFGASQAQQAQAQATANNQNQEAQKTALDNQFQQAALPYMIRALHGYSNGGAPQSNPADISNADSSGVSSVPGYGGGDPNSDTNLRQRNLVAPFLPGEQQQLGQAAILSNKMPGILQAAQFQRDQRIALQTQQNQARSGNLFDGMRAVVGAQTGQAMATLAASNMAPGTVQLLASQFKDDKDGADNAAREYASHVAGAAHQYSGRESIVGTDGNYYDKQSGFQVPGSGHQGMSDEQRASLATKGMAIVNVPDGNGGQVTDVTWHAAHASSLEAWVMQAAAANGDPNSHPSVTGAPHQIAQAKSADAATAARSGATPPQIAADKAPQYNDKNGNPDPTMTNAMSDPNYKVSIPRYAYGTQPPPEVIQAKQDMAKSSAQLSQDSGETINSARAALVMYQAAQDTLAKGRFDGGTWGTELAKAGRYLPPGFQTILGTGDYQQIAKYLGNAALQSGKGTFAKMTQQEATWMRNELNPSTNMTPDALSGLIKMNIKQAQYVIDSAGRANAYVGPDAAHPKMNPNKFPDWNQKYYPMQDAVKEDSAPQKINVIHPNGTTGSIPASQWKAAEKLGYKKAP